MFLGTDVGINGDVGDDGRPGASVSAESLFYHIDV